MVLPASPYVGRATGASVVGSTKGVKTGTGVVVMGVIGTAVGIAGALGSAGPGVRPTPEMGTVATVAPGNGVTVIAGAIVGVVLRTVGIDVGVGAPVETTLGIVVSVSDVSEVPPHPPKIATVQKSIKALCFMTLSLCFILQ